MTDQASIPPFMAQAQKVEERRDLPPVEADHAARKLRRVMCSPVRGRGSR